MALNKLKLGLILEFDFVPDILAEGPGPVGGADDAGLRAMVRAVAVGLAQVLAAAPFSFQAEPGTVR